MTDSASGLERRIEFIPAFDKRSADPSKYYGISSMRLRFLVVGPKGAVQWMIGTNWYVASAVEHLSGFPVHDWDLKRRPDGWDLGYHSPTPMYDDQKPMDHCEILGDGKCYYDGSSLQAELPVEGFLAGGLDYLWPKLEAQYRYQFEGEEWPFREEADSARKAGRFI